MKAVEPSGILEDADRARPPTSERASNMAHTNLPPKAPTGVRQVILHGWTSNREFQLTAINDVTIGDHAPIRMTEWVDMDGTPFRVEADPDFCPDGGCLVISVNQQEWYAKGIYEAIAEVPDMAQAVAGPFRRVMGMFVEDDPDAGLLLHLATHTARLGQRSPIREG